MNALRLTTAPCREESVNMVQGWRREEEGWVRVRSVMDSGCGVSVAPPGMCPTYPITESEGSRRGQDFMPASEDTMPNIAGCGPRQWWRDNDQVPDFRREQSAKLDHRDMRRWSSRFWEPRDFRQTWWHGCGLGNGNGKDHTFPAGE